MPIISMSIIGMEVESLFIQHYDDYITKRFKPHIKIKFISKNNVIEYLPGEIELIK